MVELPYCAILSNIPKYFERIKQAETPNNRFTQEFVKNTLNFKSGNDLRIIPLLKSMKFVDDSGNPLQLYREFRSESSLPSKSIGTGVKSAYSVLFSRDRDIHKATEDVVKGHVIAITGKGENSPIVRLVTQTFMTLVGLSDFTSESTPAPETLSAKQEIQSIEKSKENEIQLTYTIVLNLPTTTTKEVYDTIFTSLRENLLNK